MRTATSLGEGHFLKCDGCRETLYAKEVERNQRVCPKCGFHFRLSVEERLKLLFDDGAFQLLFADVHPTDPLRFREGLGMTIIPLTGGVNPFPALRDIDQRITAIAPIDDEDT